MKVLFLDFDGPLYPHRAIVGIPENAKMSTIPEPLNTNKFISYWKMDPIAVHMLNSMYDVHPFDTVISSSWAQIAAKEEIEALFHVNGLNLTLHKNWVTPRKMSSYRINEIAWWLGDNPVDDYIIIDDVASGDYLADFHSIKEHHLRHDRVFLVDVENGIGYMQYLKMKSIVLDW